MPELARPHKTFRTPLLLLVTLLAPAFCIAGALININTADEATLETLPGIGPSKAAAIITYRTDNGPFATIEDIENVSGIGPSTFAEIEPYITVGDTSPAAGASTQTASSTPSSGGAANYVPPPASLIVSGPSDSTAYLEVPASFSAKITTGTGGSDPGAEISWNFGDGSTQSGNPVTKTYRYPGTYLVTITATDGSANGQDSFAVKAVAVAARIAGISGEGIRIANDSSVPLDLSGWRLSSEGGSFRFPAGSFIMASSSVLYPYAITNLPVSVSVLLLFPDSVVAATYPAPAPLQPLSAPTRTNVVSGTDAVIKISESAHDTATVVAPAATENTSAVAGAPFDASSSLAGPAAATLPSGGHSTWLVGALGILAVAGGAFLIL